MSEVTRALRAGRGRRHRSGRHVDRAGLPSRRHRRRCSPTCRAEHLRTASGLGAGRPGGRRDRPQLVVVAVPPDHLGRRDRGGPDATDAVVTDVGSIKRRHCATCRRVWTPTQLTRYVGSHPMAGSERSGPAGGELRRCSTAGRGRSPHTSSRADAIAAVAEALAELCGAVAVAADPRRARPGGRAHLAPAPPRRRARRRPAGRGARRAPRPVRPGGPRRHPDRRQRPGAVAADRRRQRRRRARVCWARCASSWTP